MPLWLRLVSPHADLSKEESASELLAEGFVDEARCMIGATERATNTRSGALRRGCTPSRVVAAIRACDVDGVDEVAHELACLIVGLRCTPPSADDGTHLLQSF